MQTQIVPKRQNTNPLCPKTTKSQRWAVKCCNADTSPILKKPTHCVPRGQNANPDCPKATKDEFNLFQDDKIPTSGSQICPKRTKYQPWAAKSCKTDTSPILNKPTQFVPRGQNANPDCPKATSYEPTLSQDDKIPTSGSQMLHCRKVSNPEQTHPVCPRRAKCKPRLSQSDKIRTHFVPRRQNTNLRQPNPITPKRLQS